MTPARRRARPGGIAHEQAGSLTRSPSYAGVLAIVAEYPPVPFAFTAATRKS